jgi:ABC-type Fe3+/spermidine/putrescine transport system ATPase subunit
MARRLAVLKDGRVIQVGSPDEVYRNPANDFVAAFIGETNLIDGVVRSVSGGRAVVDTDIGTIEGNLRAGGGLGAGMACTVSVRPEDIALSGARAERNSVEARVAQYTFLGEVGQFVFKVGGRELKALVAAPTGDYGASADVFLSFPAEKVLVFPAKSQTGGEGR